MCVFLYMPPLQHTHNSPLQSPVINHINQGQAGTSALVAKKETAYGRQGLHLLQLLPPTWAPVLMASWHSINTAHEATPPCLYTFGVLPFWLTPPPLLRFSSNISSAAKLPLALALPPSLHSTSASVWHFASVLWWQFHQLITGNCVCLSIWLPRNWESLRTSISKSSISRCPVPSGGDARCWPECRRWVRYAGRFY